MSLSMYQAAVPSLLQVLQSLQTVLDKAAAHCAEHKIAPEVLLQSRLFPDMFPLTRQIQIVTDQAKGLVSRLAGVDVPAYPDTETSFADLTARLAKTADYVKSFTPEQIDGTEDKTITLKIGAQEMSFPGKPYLFNFVFPNFYFHATTAYAILRNNGVALSKRDFLGPLP